MENLDLRVAISEKILLLIPDLRVVVHGIQITKFIWRKITSNRIKRGCVTHLLGSWFTWLASFILASSSISMEQNTGAEQLILQLLRISLSGDAIIWQSLRHLRLCSPLADHARAFLFGSRLFPRRFARLVSFSSSLVLLDWAAAGLWANVCACRTVYVLPLDEKWKASVRVRPRK